MVGVREAVEAHRGAGGGGKAGTVGEVGVGSRATVQNRTMGPADLRKRCQLGFR